MLKRNRKPSLCSRIGSAVENGYSNEGKAAKVAYAGIITVVVAVSAIFAPVVGLAAVIKRRRNADNSDARTSAS